jgi:hypothetical protein
MPRLQPCNIVGKTDVSGYVFDPFLSRGKNLRMGSKAYPEMSYLPYKSHRVITRKSYNISFDVAKTLESLITEDVPMRLFLLNLTSLHAASVTDI